MDTPPLPSLASFLAAVPDPRSRRGTRHPLMPILLLLCLGMLCDRDSQLAIAQWGRDLDPSLIVRLGFTRRPPCVATIHRVCKRLDVARFEAAIQAWVEAVSAVLAIPWDGIAIDGKTLRGSRTADVPGVHLLSAFGHQLGMTLAQCPVDGKTNEIGAMPDFLADLVLTDRVVTVDALLTQREVAQTIREKGGTT